MSNLIIAAVVVIVVGLALFSTVVSSVQDAKQTNKDIISDPNSTSSDIHAAQRDNNLLSLMTLGYILLLLFGSGTLFYFGAKS